jgi:hypothetical protein
MYLAVGALLTLQESCYLVVGGINYVTPIPYVLSALRSVYSTAVLPH